MNEPKEGTRKDTKTKKKKIRSHVSLHPNMNKAAELLGGMTFGTKTAYLEHLILKDLERQGLGVDDIDKLASGMTIEQVLEAKAKRLKSAKDHAS